MNFLKNFYLLIIIIILKRTSARKFQSGADFTADELRHVSEKLKPVECMRLIEAIYSVLPSGNVHVEDVGIRETPVNTWISKHACLDGLKSWSDQFPVHLDEGEPKARVVMVIHLKAIGRSDLGNYLLKKHKKDKRFTLKKKNHSNDIIRRNSAIEKNRNPGPAVHELAKRSLSLTESSEKFKNILLSKNFFVSVTVSFLIATIVCGFFLFVIRKRLKNSRCCKKRRNLHRSRNAVPTNERGLQCSGFAMDDQSTQISEIDVENGSWCDKKFVETETQTWISDTGNETFRVSIEELGIPDDLDLEEERTSCDVRKFIKKENKTKRKRKERAKEDKKSAMEYVKVIKDKIIPSRNNEERRSKRHGRDHWVCQCFNKCTSFHENKTDDSSKVKKGSKKRVTEAKKERAGGKNKSRRLEKRRKSSKIEDQVPILALNKTSVASRSPKLKKERRDLNTERKILAKNFSRVKKRVGLVSSSSSSETEFQPNMK